MKRILLTLSTAMIFLAACNSDKKESLNTDKQIVFTDTSGAKAANASTDRSADTQVTATTAAPAPKPEVRTITKIVRVPAKETPPVTTATPPPATTAQAPATVSPAPVPATTADGTGTTTTAAAPAAEKKKTGWSSAAKGTTIGAVGGAAAGAIIGKGAKGAVIGGVLGAAGGYILGRKADRKSGRVDTTTN